MQGRFLLDVVISQCAAILKLLTSEDQTLLIRRDTFLVLNLLLDILDRIGRFDIERDRFAREGLDEDLHRHLYKDGMNQPCILEVHTTPSINQSINFESLASID